MSRSGRQRHAAELRAVDVRNAVVLGQPLVDECVVRRQQIEDAAIFVHDAAEEQFDLALERAAQVVVEVREQVHDRLACLQRAHAQPLSGEVADQRFGLADPPACAAPAARARPDP